MPERSRVKSGPSAPPLPPVRPHHLPVDIERIVLAGHRGQSMRFLGRVIAHAGMLRGHHVTWLPMFSPVTRGPTIHCTVLVSRETIGSPLAGVPDVALAFDAEDFALFEMRLKAGGLMLYDSSAIDTLPEAFRDDIRNVGIPAAQLASELGNPILASMVMLGAFAGSSRLVDERSVHDALKRVLATSDPLHLLDPDRKAVAEGLRYVRERRYMYDRYAYSIFSR